MAPGLASGNYVAAVGTSIKEMTLTDKAQRVLGLVNQVSDQLGRTESRLLPPRQEKSENAPPTPEPGHVVFILEAAEQRLENILNRLNHLSDTL